MGELWKRKRRWRGTLRGGNTGIEVCTGDGLATQGFDSWELALL